ncbi:hypothetical protein [Victivallis sp. Marseille-Q1083]|uniref:hypothetical protein n=1 Tax=Victivallis sp. Marseille-Q1083 TaxID=2717288 RepID=UPI0015886D70|nr:hypothetical protein [Victivallis sp. Marseille-Q1083]
MLDLSKLAALELPKKEVAISVLGEKQNVTISAFGDDIALQMSDISHNRPDDAELRIRRLLFSRCVEGMNEQQIELLLEKDGQVFTDIQLGMGPD